jgi:type VI protein secretion system component VasK
VSETTLRVDGQALVYRNTPEAWEQLTWPGKANDGPAGASIQVRGASFKDEIRRYGEFAFIRLLTEGGAKPVAPGAVDLEAAWDLNRGDTRVTIQFRPPASKHPFQKGFFSALQCPPAVIASGGSESD